MRGTPILLLAAVALLLAGCPDTSSIFDFDGDGIPDTEDCGPEDATVYLGAPDPYGDGVDQDCDLCTDDTTGDGVDRDCDGYPAAGDGTFPP